MKDMLCESLLPRQAVHAIISRPERCRYRSRRIRDLAVLWTLVTYQPGVLDCSLLMILDVTEEVPSASGVSLFSQNQTQTQYGRDACTEEEQCRTFRTASRLVLR
jgi:hypothetical protein